MALFNKSIKYYYANGVSAERNENGMPIAWHSRESYGTAALALAAVKERYDTVGLLSYCIEEVDSVTNEGVVVLARTLVNEFGELKPFE